MILFLFRYSYKMKSFSPLKGLGTNSVSKTSAKIKARAEKWWKTHNNSNFSGMVHNILVHNVLELNWLHLKILAVSVWFLFSCPINQIIIESSPLRKSFLYTPKMSSLGLLLQYRRILNSYYFPRENVRVLREKNEQNTFDIWWTQRTKLRQMFNVSRHKSKFAS